jgi:acetyltransferase-like isoleucine patch superfamily enzyme
MMLSDANNFIEGERVVIFPGAVIGRRPMAPRETTQIDYDQLEFEPAWIGDGSVIGAHAVIYSNVRIGKNCLIGDSVHIRENVVIGDNCIIGISTKVGARTTIGHHTRVMDLSNVASDARLGNHVFIGPGVMMGNDNSMGRNYGGDGRDFAGPVIEDYVTVGMNTSILPNTTIGRDSIVAAGSVVTRDIAPGILAMGAPAKKCRDLKKAEMRCR